VDWLAEKFQDNSVRFLKTGGGQIVAYGSDVVKALKGDAQNAAKIIETNVRSKWWIDMPNPNGGLMVRCLLEQGVYQLCANPKFDSDFALTFQDWLFETIENQDIDITDSLPEEYRQKLKQGFIDKLALSPLESESFEVRVTFNPATKETSFSADFGEGIKLEDDQKDALLNSLLRPLDDDYDDDYYDEDD